MKKILSCLLVAAMLITTVPVIALTAFAQTTIDENATTVTIDETEFVVIRTKDDLLAQFDDTNNVTNNLILANDIDFDGEVLEKQLCQLRDIIFDGNGHTISGFSLKSTDSGMNLLGIYNGTGSTIRNLTLGTPEKPIEASTSATGGADIGILLGYTNATATLENINVYGKITYEGSAAVNAGLLCARLNGKYTIRNCNVYGSVTTTGSGCTGGLIGKIDNNNVTAPVIENCNNFATVSGTGKVSGFIGQLACKNKLVLTGCTNYGNVSGTAGNVGGFVGEYYAGGGSAIDFVLTNCANNGKISGTTNIGGIFGYFNSQSNGNGHQMTMTACRNYSTISATGAGCGGLIGGAQTKDNIIMNDCTNYGTVSGTSQVGGLIGLLQKCIATNRYELTGCKNYGSVIGSGGDGGGILGNMSMEGLLVATNCANLGSISGGNNRAGFCGSFTANVEIHYFINTGNVTSNSRAAGVTGWVGGNKSLKLDYCLNLGELSGKGNSGGIMAEAASTGTATMTNCINAGSITTTGGSYGCIIGSIGVATGENNSYLAATGPLTHLGDVVLNNWEEVLTAVNRDYSKVFGSFLLNENGNGIVSATPKFVGVQESAVENGSFNVRLIATIDTVAYTNVGFNITVNGSETVNTLKCRSVFMKLLGNKDGKMISYTASDLGGSYIYALVLEGLSADESYSFTITPFATDADGETVYTGTACTVRYVNGVYTIAD